MGKQTHRAGVGALLVLTRAGCSSGKFDVSVDAHVVERKLNGESADLVDVIASPKAPLTTRISRLEIVGKEPLERGFGRTTFSAESFPVGTTRVKVKVTGEVKNVVRKWSTAEAVVDVDVVRPALQPRARIAPAGAISGGCGIGGERVCASAPSIDVMTGKADVGISAPPGTKVELLGRTIMGKGTSSAVTASFDFSKELLSTPLDTQIPVSVKVTSPDGVAETKATSIPVSAGMFRSALDNVKKGPVRFANEPANVGPARVVAFKDGTTTTFHGKGRLPELELVAFVESLPTRNMSCGTYVGQTTGRRVTISNSAYDKEVVVYERKTGRVRTRRTFRAAMPGCSSSTSSASGSGGFVPSKDLVAYVETLVGR